MATVGLIMDGEFETAAPVQDRSRRPNRFVVACAVAVGRWIDDRRARDPAAWSTRPVEEPRVSRFVLPVDTLAWFNPSVPAISRRTGIAYTWGPEGSRTLSLHRMADPEGAPLADFGGASYPFFSPDSAAWVLRRR